MASIESWSISLALPFSMSSCWIIRYSRVAPPDVLYTHNVPDEIVHFYNRECLNIDPFSEYWKRWEKPGILTLSGLENASLEINHILQDIPRRR